MCHKEVDKSRPHRLLLVKLPDHEEVGGQRHHLPEDEEEKCIGDRDHQQHGANEHACEETDRCFFRSFAEGVQTGRDPDQRDDPDQQGGKGIHPQRKFTKWRDREQHLTGVESPAERKN